VRYLQGMTRARPPYDESVRRLRLASAGLIVAVVFAARPALAEIVDVRGPVRVGWGWSHLFHARVLSLSCDRSRWSAYLLSGLHGWALARQDWLGDTAGPSYAFGIGFDLGGNFVVPVLDAVMGPLCKAR